MTSFRVSGVLASASPVPPNRRTVLCRAKRSVCMALATIITIGVGGCGAASAPSSAGFNPAPFEKILAGHTQAVFPPLPPSPPAARHKFVVSIECDLAAQGCSESAEGVDAAAKALGWRVLTIDTHSDPDLTIAAFQQAQQLHANGLTLDSLPAGVLTAPVAAARARGVPVACIGCGPFPENNSDLAKGRVSHQELTYGFEQGEVDAADLVLASHGTAQILMTHLLDFPIVRQHELGALKVFSMCGGCKVVTTINHDIADLSSGQFATEVKAALQTHPAIHYVFIGYGAGATAANTAIQQLGLTDVHTWTSDGLPENLASIDSGGAEAAETVQPLGWLAYARMDDLNRAFNGKPMLKDDHVPFVLVTRTNVRSWIDGRTGGINYAADYARMWGVTQ
jgi:ribose transport system substrate-binding protein